MYNQNETFTKNTKKNKMKKQCLFTCHVTIENYVYDNVLYNIWNINLKYPSIHPVTSLCMMLHCHMNILSYASYVFIHPKCCLIQFNSLASF